MYEYPALFDAAFFVGKTLEMICINANQIYLHFNNGARICAEVDFEFCSATDNSEIKAAFVPARQENLLVSLLEQRVDDAFLESGNVLRLNFRNGCTLKFPPDRRFESFRVQIEGLSFVI